MNDFAASVALWLADYFLLGTILLAFALAGFAALKQPAHRLAVTKSTIVALGLLAVLCALPEWSLVHLLASEVPQQSRAAGPSVLDEHALLRIKTPNGEITPPINEQAHGAPFEVAIHTPARNERFWTNLDALAILGVAYMSGSILVTAWLALGVLAAHRLICRAKPACVELTVLLNKVSAHSIPHTRLLIAREINVAIALGIRRPTIVLPQSLFDPQSAIRNPKSEIGTILAHELAHITNRDLHWLAASRALLVFLWPQPLFWFLRHRMRLDQEALADAAAAEVTTRQSYAEQLINWARALPRRPAPRLSAAVGFWEGRSQLRQRIAILLDEQLTIVHACPRRLRLSALALVFAMAMALSTVTVQPSPHASAQPGKPATTALSESLAPATSPSDSTTIGDRFVLCPVITNLQRSLLGDVADPNYDASLCLFVNFAPFRSKPLDAHSKVFASLDEELGKFALNDDRLAIVRVLVFPTPHFSFDEVRSHVESLAKLCSQRARAAGYKYANWNYTLCSDFIDGEFVTWPTFLARADFADNRVDANAEQSTGNSRVRVFPVQTYLSRLLINADCVVNVIPVIRQKEGTQFPHDFLPALREFVPQREYKPKKSLVLRVRFDEAAKEGLEAWINDRAARPKLARELGFEIANLQMSHTDEPDEAAAQHPVDIPIIVAKRVMIHDGKIIEWADVEQLVTELSNPELARPGFYFTRGALPEREEEIRAKIWDFRKRQKMVGHIWGSILPRTSIRYDAVRTAADLTPNNDWRVIGTVETVDGLPIDGAEVVLATKVDESLPYKTIDIYLRNERLRQPLDEDVTTSDNSGRFTVYPPPDTPYYVIALHKEGFGLARSDEFAKSNRIHLRPWAHIRGQVKQGDRFKQTASATESVPESADWPNLVFHQFREDLGPPSPDGHFELAFIPPNMQGILSRMVAGEQGTSYSLPEKEFKLGPAQTLEVNIGPPTDENIRQIDLIKGLRTPPPTENGDSSNIPEKTIPGPAAIRDGKIVDDSGKVLPASDKTLLRSK